MNWLKIIFGFGAGSALGIFYFWGLWLTVKSLLRSSKPALVVAGSFAGRLAVSAAVLLLLARGGWEALLAAGAGFFMARTLLAHLLGPGNKKLLREAAGPAAGSD